jgi:uncharacterized protein (TIGR02466 family)
MTTAALQAFSYFPAMVYRDEHPEWVGYLKEAAKKYYIGLPKDGPLCQTYSMVNDPELKFLVDYLVMASDIILREQGYAVDRYELYVAGLWGQEVKCNGGTDVHAHKHSQICGWFFLETPEGGAYPVYHEPRMNKAVIELDYAQNLELTDASPQVHFDNVKPGTILMANSWLQHQLTQNNSQAQTKSIHFVVSHRDR